jgi:hypothetical protein
MQHIPEYSLEDIERSREEMAAFMNERTMSLLEAWKQSASDTASFNYHGLIISITCTTEEYVTLQMAEAQELRLSPEDMVVYFKLLKIDPTKGWQPC